MWKGDVLRHYNAYRLKLRHFNHFPRNGVFEEYFELFVQIIEEYMLLQKSLSRISEHSRKQIEERVVGIRAENMQDEIRISFGHFIDNYQLFCAEQFEQLENSPSD